MQLWETNQNYEFISCNCRTKSQNCEIKLPILFSFSDGNKLPLCKAQAKWVNVWFIPSMLALDQSCILCKSLLKFTLVFSEVTVWMISSGSGIVVRLWAVLKSLSHCDRWNAFAQCHQGPKVNNLCLNFNFHSDVWHFTLSWPCLV